MSDKISIRKLVKNDIDAFFDLRLEALLNAPSNFGSTYEEEKLSKEHYTNILEINSSDNIILGSFINKNLVGCLGVYQEKSFKTKHRCNIWGMYIKSEHRNKGIGKSLIESAIIQAKNNMECEIINLTVQSNNITAIKLYKSFGFKKWGHEAMALKVDEKYYDEDHMALLL